MLRGLVIGTVLAAAGLACDANGLPGTSLGTYNVTAKLTTNTCGAGLGVPDPWTFQVDLSQDTTTLYWRVTDDQRSAPLSSALSGSSASFTKSQVENVDGTNGMAGPCFMERDDSVALTLGAGSPPPSFTGTIGYAFGVAGMSDCGDQLSVTGGEYDTLPCSVAYSMSAVRQ